MRRGIYVLLSAVVIAILGCLGSSCFQAPARASGGVSGSDRLIVTSAFSRTGIETLYVLDTRGMRLAAYEMKQGGLALVSVRRIADDFRLIVARDSSAKGLRVADLMGRYKSSKSSSAQGKPAPPK